MGGGHKNEAARSAERAALLPINSIILIFRLFRKVIFERIVLTLSDTRFETPRFRRTLVRKKFSFPFTSDHAYLYLLRARLSQSPFRSYFATCVAPDTFGNVFQRSKTNRFSSPSVKICSFPDLSNAFLRKICRSLNAFPFSVPITDNGFSAFSFTDIRPLNFPHYFTLTESSSERSAIVCAVFPSGCCTVPFLSPIRKPY